MPELSTLSKYNAGSFKELVSITVPFMLAFLSGNAMQFIDRLLLANYSIEVMNAVASSGMAVNIFIVSAISIAAMSEVFVGQFNGAKKKSEVGKPVWQMIYFSLSISIILIPLAIWGGEYILPKELYASGHSYYQVIMLFGPTLPMFAAICGFFAGIGRAKIISVAAFAGNAANIILDLLLIYGVEGYIPELGAFGAAIATAASQVIQLLIVFTVFLSKRNREEYNTLNCTFDKKILKDCINIGYPNSIAHASELCAWLAIFHICAAANMVYVTVVTMGQNIFLLFNFMMQGIEKGVIAVASNLIGAKLHNKIPKLIKTSLMLLAIVVSFLTIPLLVFPEYLISLFNIEAMHSASEGAKIDLHSTMYYQIVFALRSVWVYFIFDGMVWIFAGILTAGGDTKFTMIVNASTAWLIVVIPSYFLVFLMGVEPYILWVITVFYSIANAGLFYLRICSGSWKKLDLSLAN